MFGSQSNADITIKWTRAAEGAMGEAEHYHSVHSCSFLRTSQPHFKKAVLARALPVRCPGMRQCRHIDLGMPTFTFEIARKGLRVQSLFTYQSIT